jgi:putative membrane protein
MSSSPRRPAAFRLDDPRVAGVERSDGIRITPEPDPVDLPVPAGLTAPRKRWAWASLFWAAFGGLVSLALGLAITALIEELYARAAWLGTAGLVLAALAGFALLALLTRELMGLLRLRTIEKVHARAAEILVSDDRIAGRALVDELLALFAPVPRLARPRANLQSHLGAIIDGADLIRLAERELMAPLDREASRIVAGTAKRVSMVTAVSPRAALDMAFVLFAALTMIRRLAALYGGRPGLLGLLRLVRLIVTHLAVTGGIAIGDGLIQQVLGHGVAAKLSARLGEGVLNGLLTARLGLAAIEVARPLPFAALARPAFGDLAGDLLRRRETGPPEP